ncbi:MAG: GNAT family N-acetyltransferase [Chloroflexi bacterium]|nr:GNAT family N-acetyltransferase [Chloroflexota bacterium]
MTEPADILDLHLAALFTQDEEGNLIATNDPEPDQVAAPRLYLGRSPERCVLRFRRGMDESTRAALRDLAAPDLTANDPNREPVNQAAIEALLAAEQPIQNIYFGPAFRFPDVEAAANPLRHSGSAPSTWKGEGWGGGQGEGDPEYGSGRTRRVPSPSMGEGKGEGDSGLGSRTSTSSPGVSQTGEPNPGPLRHSGESRNPGSTEPSHARVGAVREPPLQRSANVPGGGNPGPQEVVEISPSTTHLLSPEYAWLADELKVRNPVIAVVVDGMTVSVCFSARATAAASEAGVETLPEHRGRRYAGAVTAAWAAEVRCQGRIPLYSTSWTNHASRRVAARLGLIQYATDFHIS